MHKSFTISALCGATSIFALMSGPALAQSGGQTAGVEELVITAQRREERLTEVPIAVTVLGGEQLAAAGVRSATDLTSVAPGFNVTTNGAYAQPVVRGVTSSVTAPGADSNVATYIDGVYQPNQTGNYADLVGIEQIEILKGPQGTLFGRNATGGAVVIRTRDPKFDPSFEGSAQYGSFNEVRLTAYMTAPITDRIAFNLSGLFGQDDGFMRNLATGNKIADYETQVLRGKVLFNVNDNFDALLSMQYTKRKDGAPFAVAPINGNNSNIARAGVIVPRSRREASLTFDPAINTESFGSSLKLTYDMGFATFTSLSAYQQRNNFVLSDSDRLNLPITTIQIFEYQNTFTQEFNLVSNGDTRARWFAGLYYYQDDAHGDTVINGGIPRVTDVDTKAISPFAEINYALTDKIFLIGGLRYNIEKKSFVGFVTPQTISGEKTFKNLSPRLGARYSPDLNSSIYATWSRGFKSGLFDTGSFSTRVIKPEKIDAYEVGYKYGRGSTILTLSAYYYDYKDVQYQALNPTAAGTVVDNAAKAEIYGAEADFSFRPIEGLQLRAAGAYTHGEYKEFLTALIYQPLPAGGNALILLGQRNPVTGEINSTGASGNRLMRTPRFTGTLSANYSYPLGNDSKIELSSSLYYSGSYYWAPQNRLKQDSYTLLNGEVGYVFPGGRLKASVWGRNLTNAVYQTYVVDTLVGDAGGYGRPRTYGVAASVRF